MNEKEKKYYSSDFARYHSGTMSPDEMQALEKASLEDPFLADALEGYAYSRNSEKELAEIKLRLSEKGKRNKVFSLYSLSSRRWWQIAAMFIVVAGVGYFFFFLYSKKERSLAVKEVKTEKESAAISSIPKRDTTTEGSLAFENTSKDKNKGNPAKLPAPVTQSAEPSLHSKAIQKTLRKREKKGLAENHNSNENENIVAMNNVRNVPEDVIKNDSGEKSFFHLSDTTTMIAASPLIYDANADKTFAMNKRNPALQDVVVTGYGGKKKSGFSRELKSKVSGVAIDTSIPFPMVGQEKFNQYIKDNAIPVLDATGNKIEADILLSFMVSKKGKPIHIKVIESSCNTCEEEAIKLLKEGPRWIGKAGAAGSVRIKF